MLWIVRGVQMKSYQAYGTGNCRVTKDTPRQAAMAFFDAFPNKRKCDITEGVADGHFFVVAYWRASNGERPRYWKDVTKSQATALPDDRYD